MAAAVSSRTVPPPAPIVDPILQNECVKLTAAASITRRSPETVRRWIDKFSIGRQISRGSPWMVSVPALLMVAAGDKAALAAFRMGEREHSAVSKYIEQAARI